MASYSTAGKTYALRMILLGEAGAGKSCLYHWIKYKLFRDESVGEEPSPPSLATSRQRQYDQHSKQIVVSPTVKVTLTVVDTADREKYQSLTAHYYRRADIVLLVCSLDDEVTLNRLTKWHQEAQHYINDQDILFAVCGVKSDLQIHEKEVTIEMMKSFAMHLGFQEGCVFEVSAKTGAEIANMLKTLCSTAVDRIQLNMSRSLSLRNPAEHSSLLGNDYSMTGDGDSLQIQNIDRNSCCSCKCVVL